MTQNCCSDGWYEKDVPVGHPDFAKLFLCDCPKGQAIKARRAQRVMGKCLIPDTQTTMTFASFYPQHAVPLKFPDPTDKSFEANRIRRRIHALDGKGLASHVQKIKGIAQAYAANPHDFLTFLGEPGCGKTHLAAAIANQCAAQSMVVSFAVVPDLLDALRSTFDKKSRVRYADLLDAYKNADLLILDDIGSEQSTEWALEKLYQIINWRYNERLPLVITTNEVPLHFDPRLHSRLFDQRNQTLELLAGDYRLKGKARKAA